MTDDTRNERDSLGEVRVPASAYYGAQTQRAVTNFPISSRRFPRAFIGALGAIKEEAARVCREQGHVAAEICDAVARAAAEVRSGEHDDQFVVDIFQTGSGTSTNMNANEVVANRAIEVLGGTIGSKSPVHPNDHVNFGQSSNDVIPSALHIAAASEVTRRLLPALERLASALRIKSREFDEVVKLGRTHLQDAVPVRLGQEVGAWATQVEYGIDRIRGCLPRLCEVALGGTAVGTGLNAPDGFAAAVIARLAASTELPLVGARDRFEALSARDAAVETSGQLKTLAVSLSKVANDLRWLSSGPRGGLGELALPAVQPGSSIMPGKVNPVLPEAVAMVCAQVMGNDVVIGFGGASGNFELNVMIPVIASNLLESISILASGCDSLVEFCIEGIVVNRERASSYVEQSLSMATALAPEIGYDRAAKIAQEAHGSGRTVREVAREAGVLPADELDRVLDPLRQTRAGQDEVN